MSEDDLVERLDAVERRLDAAYPEPTDGAVDSDTIERVETFAERLADLEAAVEAVEGYVGEIERVDGELEQRADAALAAVNGIEDRTKAVEDRTETVADRTETVENRMDAVEDRIRTTAADDGLDARLDEQTAAIDELQSELERLGERVAGIETGSLAGRGDRSDAREPGADADPGIGWESATGDGVGSDRRCGCDSTASASTGVVGGTDSVANFAGGSHTDSAGERGDTSLHSLDPEAGGPSSSRDDRRRTAEHGTGSTSSTGIQAAPDGGNAATDPARRSGSAPTVRGSRSGSKGGNAAVSGWGDPTGTERATENGPKHRSAGAAAGADEEDGSWTDASADTLLDRLRSML